MSTQNKNRWGRRWGLRLLFVFLMCVFVILSPLRDVFIRPMLEQQLTSRLGESVWIPEFHSTLWPLQIQIKGLQIGDEEDVYVQVVQLDMELQIETDQPFIRSVDIQSPVVVLPIDEQGLVPFRNRVRGSKPLSKVPFEQLNVYDATLVVHKGDIRGRVSDVFLRFQGDKGVIEGMFDPIEFRGKKISVSPVHTEFQYEPTYFHMPHLALDIAGVGLEAEVEVKDGLKASISMLGVIPEVVRGSKLHLEGVIESTIQITKKDSLEVWMEGVVHNTELHRLLRTGERDFLPFQELTHKLRWEQGMVYIEQLQSPFATGDVLATGQYNPALDLLDLTCTLKDVPLWQLGQDMRLSSHPWVEGILNGELGLSGSLKNLELTGPFSLDVRSLESALGPIRESARLVDVDTVLLDGSLAITRSNLHIQEGSLVSGANRAGLEYFIQWGADPKTDIQLDFSTISLETLRPLAGMDFVGQGKLTLHLWGIPKAYQFDMASSIQDFGLLGFGPIDLFTGAVASHDLKHWNFETMEMIHRETLLKGTLDIDFSTRSLASRIETQNGRVEDLVPIFFDFTDLRGAAEGWVSLEGPFQDLSIQSKISMKKASLWGEPFEEGDFSMQMRQKFLTVDTLYLHSPQKELFMHGSMNEAKELNFEVYSNHWDLNKIDFISRLQLPLDGSVRMHTNIQGTGIRPRGSIHLMDVSYNTISLGSGVLNFSMESGNGFVLEGGFPEAGISYSGQTQSLSVSDNYAIDIRMNDFPAHIFYPQTRTGEKLRIDTSGELHIESYSHEFFIEAGLERMTCTIQDQSVSLLKPTSVAFQSNEISLSGVEIGDRNKTYVQISGGKTYTGDLDYEIYGTVDLSYLPPFLGLVQRSSGTAKIKGSLQGHPSTPIPQFDVEIVDGYFTTSWWDHPYEEVQGRLFVSPYRYELQNWKGRMGGGDFLVGGIVASDYFSVQQLDMNLQLYDGQVQVISWLPSIRGDANLRLVGTLDEMLLKGDVGISSMLFSKRIDWEDAMISIDSTLLEEASKREMEKSWLAFDVNILSNDTIRIRNNLADVTASAQFQIIGDLNRIGTIGGLKAQRGGRILLKERDFEVQRADLRFLDPYSYDPELDIALFTRVRSIDDEYDINYFVEGLYSKWRFRSHSNPPLQQADINALLFFGMTRAELERMGGLSNTLAIEGTDLLASKISSVIGLDEMSDNVLPVDLFSFDRFDLISGTSSSGSFSSSLRILAEKDVATGSRLRLEKDLTQTEDFYLSFEQRLANTFYLRSFWTSDQRGRYLDIGGAYGLEFQLRLEAD